MKTTHTPDVLTPASLTELVSFRESPCISLYQPTHRNHPDNQPDPIRFRHLIKDIESSLRPHHKAYVVKTLMAPFVALAEDHNFWNHTFDGLAVLGAPGLFRIFLLQSSVDELTVVADSFHTKPLRQWLQSNDRYQVLAVGLHKVQLFEGNRHTLDAVVLAPGVPQTLTEALGSEHTEPQSTVSSYGGLGNGHMPMHHGHGGKKDQVDSDAKRFFRAVDRAVLEHHSSRSGLPLMLAALPEHHHLFREVSHNPFLMENGLMINPQSLTQDELHQRVWDVISLQQKTQQAEWTEAYFIAAAKGMGSDKLSQIAHAAASGRVATLLIEAERHVAGRIDQVTGHIDSSEHGDSQVDDVLDDLGSLVEKMGGVVHVLSLEQMPCRTGAAASFRH